jgi:LPXTG-motif cell wall-anchored protein
VLPSTATRAASLGFLGAGLIAAGLMLLRKRRGI